MNDLRHAKSYYTRITRLNMQEQKPQILLDFGRVLLGLGEYDAAKKQFEAYQKLVKKTPKIIPLRT